MRRMTGNAPPPLAAMAVFMNEKQLMGKRIQ
jgi:hypothetical protein